MKSRNLLLLFVAFIFFLSTNIFSQDNQALNIDFTEQENQYIRNTPKVRMAVDPHWMPYEQINDKGEYEGMLADYMSLLSDRIGIPFVLVPTQSFKESIEMLQQGKCDIIPGDVYDPSGDSLFPQSEPYFLAARVFAVHSDTSFITDFKVLADNRIGVTSGSPAERFLPLEYPGISIEVFEDLDSALRQVETGDIDAVVNLLGPISYSLQRQALSSVKIGGVLEKEIPLSIYVDPQNTVLMGILNKAIASINELEHQQIAARWINIRYDQKMDIRVIIQISSILLIIIIFLAWRAWIINRINRELNQTKNLLEAKNRELEKLSLTDNLTGLYNRRALEPYVQQEMSRKRRSGNPVCLMILDIDHFKEVNDNYGHDQGDVVLKRLALEVSKMLRRTDIIARWGGEEFAILASETDLGSAAKLAEKVRSHVESISFPEVGKVTVSIGVSEYHIRESYTDWFKRTDIALYHAKNNGRNCIEIDCQEEPAIDKKNDIPLFINLSWSTEFECGNRIIDSQHRDLFHQATAFLNSYFLESRSWNIEKRLDLLVEALDTHFKTEEIILEDYKYDDLEAHKAEHVKLLDQAKSKITLYKEGTIKYGDLINYITQDVVTEHLFSMDIDYFSLMGQD